VRTKWSPFIVILITVLVFTTVSYSLADTGDNGISSGAVSNDEGASPAAVEEEPSDATSQPVEPDETTDGATQIDSEESPASTSQGGISPQATTEHFINIPQFDGAYPISGDVASASTTDSTRATFLGGKILGHEQGVATVTLNMANGNVGIYHISVYYKYPQPKTTIIFASGDGEKLMKWGKVGNNDYVSPERALVEGERVTLLWRAHDQDDTGNHVYQYVETSGGEKGYIDDAWNSDRPMGGYFGGTFGFGYYNDVAVGGSAYISSESGGVLKEDSKSWSSSDATVLKITMQNDGDGHDNQGFIEGEKEGYALATTTLEYDSKDVHIRIKRSAMLTREMILTGRI